MSNDAAGQLGALGRILVRTAGVAAVRRGLPFYFGVFIAAVLMFAGRYAMKASELVAPAIQWPGFRGVLLLAWLILTLPVARAWVASPSALYLRVFPIPLAAAVPVLAAGLLLVELPWIILFARGGGPIAGVWAALLAAGAHALVLGRPRRAPEVLAAGLWVGAFALPPGPALLLALPALALGCRRTWIDAWGIGVRPTGRWVVRHSPALAIATAHLASLLRRQRSLLLRWAWRAAVAVGIAALAIRNNDVVDPRRMSQVSLAVLAPVTTFNLLAVGAALLRVERRALWLLDVVGTRPAARLAGAALALGAGGLLFGLLHGALVALAINGSPRLWAAAAAEGAGLGMVAPLVVRWADRGRGQDSGRFLSAGLLLAGGVIAFDAWRGEPGVGLALVAAAAIAALLPVSRQARSAAADQD